MPSKFSYSDLAKTQERLKREAQQYLDSLDVSQSDFNSNSAAVDADTKNETTKLNDPGGSGATKSATSSSQSCDSDEDIDTLTEMPLYRNVSSYGDDDDDDSLIAMAQRLDDASVISYSSSGVRSHKTQEDDEDKPMLALPCTTGNAGLRAKKKFPKETRFGSNGKNIKKLDPKDATTSKERVRLRNDLKQFHDDIAFTPEEFESVEKSYNTPTPSSKVRGKKSRSVSREKKRNPKTRSVSCERNRNSNQDRDLGWKPNSFYERKAMADRRKSMDDVILNKSDVPKTQQKPAVEKNRSPKMSQWKRNDKQKKQVSPWNDSECTVQTNNKKDKAKKRTGKKVGSRMRGRKSHDGSDDESMRGVGCNVRIDRSKERTQHKPKRNATPRTRSSSKRRPEKDKSTASQSRSSSVPPTIKKYIPSNSAEVDTSNLKPSSDDEEVQSVYDSDANTEVFYESTEDEWSSDEEDLPMVGTSVLKAVEDLNNKSIGCKMKSMLGIRG